MNNDRQQASTLLEVLVALALMSMIISALFSLYWTASKALATQSSIADAQYNVRTAMQWIVKDIISSTPQTGASGFNDDELNLRIGTVGDSKKVVYLLRGNNLCRNHLPLLENISYLNFSSDGNSNLIKITVESSVNGKKFRLSSFAGSRIYPKSKSTK